MKLSQLPENEYSIFYKPYILAVETENMIDELEVCLHQFIKFVQDIPMDKFDYRYAEGKWTIKDIIQHLIDAERIFCYRALRISRNDKTPLPGFDENSFVENTDANSRSIQGLLTEMAVVRQSTISLFNSFSDDQMSRVGVASNANISVRALGFITIGHQKHHQKVFLERYL